MDDPQKTALITGATDGIGKALALKLLREGWAVTIVGRDPKRVQASLQELRVLSKNNALKGLTADLSMMAATALAVEEFLAANNRLDLLLLNANAVSNTRIITSEGNEKNFALGYLSRILMMEKLKPLLENTRGSQILSVIGKDTQRVDFDDVTLAQHFTWRKGLMRWQWAMQVYARAFARAYTVPVNQYIPGLVKTKILVEVPQPLRTFIKTLNLIIAITPDRAAENIYSVIELVNSQSLNNSCFSWKKVRNPLNLHLQEGDEGRLRELTEKCLKPYL